MPTSLKKPLRYAIFLIVLIVVVLFINWRIDNNKNEKKKDEKSENNPNQKTPKSPNDDDPTNNPPPVDTENWWLTDGEIEHAYQEIRKEITNSPEIQLVSPAEALVIQEGGEISDDLKKAKYIFFPINNSESYETADSGSHWTLLVFAGGELGYFFNYNSLEFSVTPENSMKVAENFHKKANLTTLLYVENAKDIPRQINNSDCGVYLIAYTRALIKKYKEGQEEGQIGINLGKKDLFFSIDEERQKLKAMGFPKKGTPGKDYDIGDDMAYTEEEESSILQWYINADTPLKVFAKAIWAKYNVDTGQALVNPSDFKEFSKKVRLLSGKINQKNTEKAKMAQIYRLKKILKACSLPLEEYKKTKSFNGKDNFQEDKITSEESQFVGENINKETVKEINDLYNIHFSGK